MEWPNSWTRCPTSVTLPALEDQLFMNIRWDRSSLSGSMTNSHKYSMIFQWSTSTNASRTGSAVITTMTSPYCGPLKLKFFQYLVFHLEGDDGIFGTMKWHPVLLLQCQHLAQVLLGFSRCTSLHVFPAFILGSRAISFSALPSSWRAEFRLSHLYRFAGLLPVLLKTTQKYLLQDRLRRNNTMSKIKRPELLINLWIWNSKLRKSLTVYG